MAKKTAKAEATKVKGAKGGRVLPVFCNVLGILMLLIVIGLCVPLTVPLVAGYQPYDVVSGSMEPEIPVGSVVYVKAVDPLEIQEGEVIAYQHDEGIVVHRVVTNRTSIGEFVTKGDANAVEDFDPIPYDAVLGRMEHHVPMLGAFMAIYSNVAGKIYLLLMAACGVMLNMVASRMRESRRAKALEQELAKTGVGAGMGAGAGASAAAADIGSGVGAGAGAGAGAGTGMGVGAGAGVGTGMGVAADMGAGAAADMNADAANAGSQAAAYSRASGNYATDDKSRRATPAPAKRRGRAGSIVRGVVIALLAVAFLGSAGVVGYVKWQYSISDALYGDATDKYLENGDSANGTIAPIKIDFNELRKENPDIIGWIYCPGTAINYPVLYGKDNDQYLHHDYTGDYNINGSIFVDSNNGYANAKASAGAEGAAGAADATTANTNAVASADAARTSSDGASAPLQYSFEDANSIIYGHHMNSGSMFAGLIKWDSQEYYEDHPEMWLLTPTQDYKIVLFSSHHVNAYSTMYQIIHKPGEELAALLGEALVESDLHANAHLDPSLARLATMKGVDLSKVQVDEDNPFVLLDAESRYVMLSTCAYLFDNDRYVLHGKLVPVNSAGGKAKKA